MKTEKIPGGEATFREYDDLRGLDADLVEDQIMAAAPYLASLPPEILEGKEVRSDLSEEERGELDEQMKAFLRDPEATRALRRIRRATVIASLDSWTLDRPVPTSLDELALLPLDLIKALEEKVGGDALTLVNGEDYSPSSDPKAGTDGSTSSSDPLTDKVLSTPTPTSSESTATTDTGKKSHKG